MPASSMMVDLARVSQASHQGQGSVKASLSPKSSTKVNGFNSKRLSPSGASQSSSPTEMDQQDALRDDVCQVIVWCRYVYAMPVSH